MAPPSKGRTTAATSSFVDHIRAFNVSVAELRIQQANSGSNSSSKALPDLEKILPVLSKITDTSG
jgi:hypothetical protein